MSQRKNREALVLPARCMRRKELFGIRAERIEKAWHLTWAFPLAERTAKNERLTNNKVSGVVLLDADYPGCPHCGNNGFVVCYNCGNAACIDDRTTVFKCPWCGESGGVESAEKFEGIKAGGY